MNYLKKFDYLSDQVNLTFNKEGEIRNKTFYGGIISIISIFLMITTGIYFFIKLIRRENKYLLTSSESSPYLKINDSNNIPFLFRLSDYNNIPYNNTEKIYKINFKFWTGGSNSTSDNIENSKQHYEDLLIEKCDLEKHFGKFKYLFEKMTDLDTFYCTFPRNSNQTLYGIYGNVFPFAYYNFYFSICDIDTNSNCYQRDEIYSILSNFYLDMRTIDYDIKSYNKDVRDLIIKSDRFMLSLTVYKRIWMFFNSIQYITDNGFFFNEEDNKTFFQYDSMRYDVDLRNINESTIKGCFLSFSALSTGHIKRYNRKYIKIQDYAASFSGIIKLISLIAIFSNYFYSQNQYYFRLINGFMIPEKQINDKYEEKKRKFEKEFQININDPIHNKLNITSVKRSSFQNQIHNNPVININNINEKNIKLKRNSMNNYNLQLLLNEENKLIIKRNSYERKNLNCLGYILPFYLYANSQKNKKELDYCYHAINDNLNVVKVLIKLVRSERLLKTYLENENGKKNIKEIHEKSQFELKNMKKTFIPRKPKKLKNFGIKIQSDNISDNSSTMKCEIESIS